MTVRAMPILRPLKGRPGFRTKMDMRFSLTARDDTMVMRYSPPVDNFTISAWVQAAEEHEIESMALQLSKIRDAGLPLMVYGWHRVLGFFGLGEGIFGWLLAGQTLTLIFRMLSLLPLYYIGKHLVGGRYAFLSLFYPGLSALAGGMGD